MRRYHYTTPKEHLCFLDLGMLDFWAVFEVAATLT